MITSRHNSKIQLVRLLQGHARERYEQNAFVVEGVRVGEEALAAGWIFRFGLYGGNLSKRGQGLVERLKAQKVEVELVDEKILQSVSETETSQGFIAVLEHKSLPLPQKPSFVLVLDQVRDPGNLGTLLRTAGAAGAELVLLLPGTTDAFSPKVVRAGMGVHFRLPILASNWGDLRERLKGLRVFLADMDGEIQFWQADFRKPTALIIGGEAEGASPEVRELAARRVRIPMPGMSESLNAAVAGAILMYEVVRQRASEQSG
jgi:TrmH family RNA methyltransferase